MSDMGNDCKTAIRLELQGPVQGCGLRPQIARLATRLGIRGWVENTVSGVTVAAVGSDASLRRFVDTLRSDFGPVVQFHPIPLEADSLKLVAEFEIRNSADSGPLVTPVPVDRATCAECLSDTRSGTRRSDYLLTSCATCGPRYSVIEAMPFDRERTTLHEFPKCKSCTAEYRDPEDRRYHAQTIGCASCGPNWWIHSANGRVLPAGDSALAEVTAALRRGETVALRGIGGYQFLCDAANSYAVERLRKKKARPTKPLAILVSDFEMANRLAHWDDLSRTAFLSAANPIVLVPARSGHGLAAGIHPGIREIGILAPTSPLHAAVAERFGEPLVITSGNRDGEPLVVGVEEAELHLAGVVDLFIHHNRPIHNPIDDSVVRVIAGKCVTLRLARGLAPLVLPDGPWGKNPRLALGGQQKVAMAIANGVQAVLGPHVGDLDGTLVQTRYLEQATKLQHVYRVINPEWIHDSHPNHETTRIAHSGDGHKRAIDHHHAHILSGMLEAGWTNRPVLGVAFDGTGWGPGDQIWGGEFLLVSSAGYRRVGCLRPIPLPGGEQAIREPWRVALALLAESLPSQQIPETAERLFPGLWEPLWHLIRQMPMSTHSRWIPRATSVGRLFDGVASLLMGIRQVTYEGEAASYLESLCQESSDVEVDGEIPLTTTGDLTQLDWRPLVLKIVHQLGHGEKTSVLAAWFHRVLAEAVIRMARSYPNLPVVLSGGCFQNRILVEEIARRLELEGREFFTPGMIPPNDGGLAAGQLVGAAMQELCRRDIISE